MDQGNPSEHLSAVDYSNIDKLFHIACKTVANQIKDKGPDEIQELFKILERYDAQSTPRNSLPVKSDIQALSKRLIALAEQLLPSTLAASEECDTVKLCFSDVCDLLVTISNSCEFKYHTLFIPYAINWLEKCLKYLVDNQLSSRISILEPNERVEIILDATSCLLGYLRNIIDVLNFLSSISAKANVSVEVVDSRDYPVHSRTDVMDEVSSSNTGDEEEKDADGDDDDDEEEEDEEDDASLIDDSDHDSLSNKLCTFTLTQKEFVNQHWYHCHTCNMVDKVGVCSVCAKVCHKDHDLSYVKFGAFFCDCAGRENDTCIALVKRSPATSNNEIQSTNQQDQSVNESSDTKLDFSKSDSSDSTQGLKRDVGNDLRKLSSFQQALASQLEATRIEIVEALSSSGIVQDILKFLTSIIPAYIKFTQNESHVSRSKRAKIIIEDLHSFLGKSSRRRKNLKSLKRTANVSSKSSFQVDFFENLQVLEDIEFGGPDILSVYSTQQVKNRLNTPGMHIVCTKTTGFSLDVINSDPNMVICGLRIQVGSQDISKSPSSAEIFGRIIPMNPATPRWYDIPFTREESLQSELRLTINFSPSSDPNVITIVDSIKVYGKTKESFSWSEEGDESTSSIGATSDEVFSMLIGQRSGRRFQHLLIYSMECLEFSLNMKDLRKSERETLYSFAKDLSASILKVPYPQPVLKNIKSLHLAIYGSKQNYHIHRDSAVFDFVLTSLKSLREDHVDGDLLSRVIVIINSLCQSRLMNLSKLSESFSLIAIDFCYNVLKHLTNYWKTAMEVSTGNNEGLNLSLINDPLVSTSRRRQQKSNSSARMPDLSPFFIRQYPKGSDSDLFEDYPQLLTEMVLRIPYQIKKVSSSSSNSLKPINLPEAWSTLLCEYLMIPIPSSIKKHVRKLLTSICGSKDKYRQLRDFHFLESYMRSIRHICGSSTSSARDDKSGNEEFKSLSLTYVLMTSLVEHLKACIEIAQNRCINWQIYCLLMDPSLTSFLMRLSLEVNDDVSPITLELLQHALNPPQKMSSQIVMNLLDTSVISTTASAIVKDQTLRDTLTSESLSANLAQQLIMSISKDLLSQFAQCFLLEANLTSLRWQAHSLLYTLWTSSTDAQKLDLIWVLWSLWNNLPKYGRKASQFVDLVGFITLKCPEHEADHEKTFCQEVLNVLKQQNQLLILHPNAHIYSSIQGLVDLDSFYLENEPCSVCNSPEVPYNTVKLNSIKVDSRFTTTTQIIKLIGSHTILKFSLRISDIKRSKMVKTVNIYYNNRTVQSVVELKNKTGIWNLARKYPLSLNQTDVKIEFTLPIVACNLMIEFAEFYENFQASSETLQCPRCSTSVSANPGVCSNCGENVFQCHKCRAINYDEKDPFLCISCGFCKYARFDISVTAKPTCAVDPIENEDDRKKTVASISGLLEKADRVYKSLVQNKPILELLLLRIHEQILPDKNFDETILTSDQGLMPLSTSQSAALQAPSIVTGYTQASISSAFASSVNKAIQQLAHKYCVECKGLFEELSKITHKVLAFRRELVEYDDGQLKKCLTAACPTSSSTNRRSSRVYSSLSSGSGRCYGCATATVEHCVTMLKALSTVPKLRAQICESGIINELVSFNLKNGSNTVGHEVRELLCCLTKNDLASTTILTDLLMKKIAAIGRQDYQPYEITHIVRHEIALLSVTLDSDDQCWELRLRCLFKIFAFSFELKNPAIMECLIIPCLKLLLSIVRPTSPSTRRHREKSLENIASVRSDNFRSRVLLEEWISSSTFTFDEWRRRAARPSPLTQGNKHIKPISSILRRSSKVQYRTNYLAEKYGNRWRLRSGQFNKICKPIASLPNDWLKKLLFNRSSKTVRLMAKSLVEALFSVQSRRKDVIDLLSTYLCEIGSAGECAQEFYCLYKSIILSDHWRYYLALQGTLTNLGSLIASEIDKLQELEETTLNSSLSLGYSLKMLLELLTSFVTVPKIRAHYKSKLVGFVLKGYLSLRKLVVQRSKTIDESQEMLLELLEGMTSGSEAETANFINVCVEAIRNCHEGDIRTPVFIFERLCSTIRPEENGNSEFFVNLEKDPQQEDYLQGRMLGNPYSSNDAGIGPLMKDIKNKICQDCELLALLEDDSSMELLVSNKIISLDLPVRDVYKRIWCAENHESDAMRIIYRMRGLLGDATEEFIESFDSRNHEEVDEEQVYKMANIMSHSGGLEIMLNRLKQIDDLSPPFRPLLDVILKLFSHCTKTKNNRLKLLSIDLKTITVLLNALKLALDDEDLLNLAGLQKGALKEGSLPTTPTKNATISTPCTRTQVIDQILSIMEVILREASKQPQAVFREFCHKTCGTTDDIRFLLNASRALSSRLSHVSHKIVQILPFLTLGDKDQMSVLVEYFKPSIDFKKFDQEHSPLIESTIDLFCIMVDAIERNENGDLLKDFIISEKIVANSTKYLTSQAPPLKSSLLAVSNEWKEFTCRPALKYVLRILGGLSQGHAATQILISRECIPIVHGLEQVSSDAKVGTLAENLLEAIKQNPAVAEKIELVRKQTREEKKRLAMAVRERQLGALGMKANERGQVTAKSKLLEQCQDLTEDTGLICNICREGYKFQPTKVLGIYTFTKRCVLDEFDAKPRKTYGYTTVTHFNTVHVECHLLAVRSARSRDEWDSAALQNANTRCNGLLPIWGPQVPEPAYASALERHNSYLQDSTGYRDIGYHSTVHDIRVQLLRFAQERSFSEDTGGGGPQSNLHLIPYMMQTALYVLNSTKVATREFKRTLNYLDMSSNEILENCYEVDSPYYWTSLAVLVLPPMWWKKKRVQFLQRLLTCNHVRRASIKPPAPMSDTRVRAYAYYKSALIFFAFVDSFYNIVFKDAVTEDRWNQDWSVSLAEYLKHNDQTVNDNIEVLLNLYQNTLLPCASMDRFFEIIRVEEITQPNEFLANTLESV